MTHPGYGLGMAYVTSANLTHSPEMFEIVVAYSLGVALIIIKLLVVWICDIFLYKFLIWMKADSLR